MRSAIVWEQYISARERLQSRIAEKIRRQMSTLVGNMESADLLLVAADGKKLPAHECILRARAPGFYQRHVEVTVAAMGPKQEGKMREVAIGDIDSAGLEFFIHSVYTEDEIAQFPTDQEEMDDRQDSSRASTRSENMEESTELDFQQGGTDERLEEETPTAGRPPLPQEVKQSGNSVESSPRRQIANSMTSSSISQDMTSSTHSGIPPMTSSQTQLAPTAAPVTPQMANAVQTHSNMAQPQQYPQQMASPQPQMMVYPQNMTPYAHQMPTFAPNMPYPAPMLQYPYQFAPGQIQYQSESPYQVPQNVHYQNQMQYPQQQTTPQQFQNQMAPQVYQTPMTSHTGQMTSHPGQMTSQVQMTSHPGQMTSHVDRMPLHQGQMTSHPGQMTSHVGQMPSHQGQMTSHSGQMTSHPGQMTSHQGQMTPHVDQMTSHSGQMKSYSDQITSSPQRIPSRQSDITSSYQTPISQSNQMTSSSISQSNQMTSSSISQSNQMTSSAPLMTSFRDMVSGSPMNTSAYSLGGRSEVTDIPEEEEDGNGTEKRQPPQQRQGVSMSKFIRLDSVESKDSTKEQLQRKRSSGGPKQIFPMFIGLSDNDSSLERCGADSLRPGRIIMSKRLSMTSLTSLTSIDMTPSNEAGPSTNDNAPASKLAADLMQMYVNNEDTDVIIKTEGGDLHAHRCILSATCPFFRQQLQKSKRIEMKGFSRNSIHYLLSFLYGGLTTIPDDVDVWEIVSLAAHLNHKDLTDVVILHLKANRCHWFHRPCAACVSAVFDALPQLADIRSLRPLYEEALSWQAKHFCRIWKGRVFIHMNERWQRECYEAVIQRMDDETVIETILGCERLQAALPRSKAESAVTVLSMVDDVLEVAMNFLVNSFHLVVTSKSFQSQGKGLALNLGILEDLLPSIIHSLTADVAIKTFRGLSDLLIEIQSVPPSPKRGMSIPIDEFSSRFASLVRRMFEIVDKHLLHYAASVVKAEAWNLLDEREQQRIQETGLFVELRQPKAPPPRLSSYNRSYKRSASVGVQFTQNNGNRTRSIERSRPLSTIQQPVPTVEPDTKPEPVVQMEAPKPAVTESPRRSRKDDLEATPEKKKTVTTAVTNQIAAKAGMTKSPSVSKIGKPASRQPSKETKVVRAPSTEKSEKPTEKEKPVERQTEETRVSEEKTEATKEPKVEPLTETQASPRRKTPEPRRSSSKKSPAKKRTAEAEEFRMERQGTHTIMSVDKSKVAHLPGPENSPTKVVEKPKSVVKPMVKDPPLASAAQRPMVRTAVKNSGMGKETKPAAVRSTIPKSVAAPKTTSQSVDAKPRSRVAVSKSTRPTQRTNNSTEK